MGIYSYNVFSSGGTNYPNISDVANTVTINPSDTTQIISNYVQLISETQTYIQSPNFGILSIQDFSRVDIENIANINILTDNAYIVANGGKLGFFSDTNSAVQANAIANATLLNVDVQLNKVLDALRAYGLIKT